ncbi:MAG: hypothetical protein M3347_02510 [Armatimonadota bacterium]|nr:hypothetical protein [Armatimonadota bacterium]
MIVTLELAPETEDRLQAKAARCGMAPDDYVRQLVERDLSEVPTPKEPASRLRGYGIAAHLPVRSEDVHRAHRQEVERETER